MKSFDQLTIRDKAQQLHEWFPNETKELITFIQGTAKGIANDSNKAKPEALKQMFSAKELKLLAVEAGKLTDTFYNLMVGNSKFFAEQLFKEGDLAVFCIDCIKQFVRIRPESKFAEAVHLFFITKKTSDH
jgi:hypothetical protein